MLPLRQGLHSTQLLIIQLSLHKIQHGIILGSRSVEMLGDFFFSVVVEGKYNWRLRKQ